MIATASAAALVTTSGRMPKSEEVAHMNMNPIPIPQKWSDGGLVTVEKFCDLIRTPQRAVRDWR